MNPADEGPQTVDEMTSLDIVYVVARLRWAQRIHMPSESSVARDVGILLDEREDLVGEREELVRLLSEARAQRDALVVAGHNALWPLHDLDTLRVVLHRVAG